MVKSWTITSAANIKQKTLHPFISKHLFPSSSAAPREGPKAPEGHMGGNNRTLVTLSSRCLRKILPTKASTGFKASNNVFVAAFEKEGGKKVQRNIDANTLLFSSNTFIVQYYSSSNSSSSHHHHHHYHWPTLLSPSSSYVSRRKCCQDQFCM